jgi:hypothetical protein
MVKISKKIFEIFWHDFYTLQLHTIHPSHPQYMKFISHIETCRRSARCGMRRRKRVLGFVCGVSGTVIKVAGDIVGPYGPI